MAREQWLDPWGKAFYTHSTPVRQAIRDKNPGRTLEAIDEHLPAMIAIRDEVASLPVPNGFRPGLFKTVFNLAIGIKPKDLLEIEREAQLKVFGEQIGDAQRELRRLEAKRR